MEILAKIPSCCWIGFGVWLLMFALTLAILWAGSDEDDRMRRG